MKRVALTIAAACLLVPAHLAAQDDGVVIVTASRSDRSNYEFYDDDQSAIGLTRTADYFVKPLFVNSDSRDAGERRRELLAMLRATIERAPGAGIALVAGSYSLQPVTLENYEELPIGYGGRPDTSRVQIFARIPVRGSNQRARDADKQIEAFAKSIPATGRSFIETGSTSLAITNPDQYRLEVVKTVAEEAKRYAAQFGSDYGVEIQGLDSELYWQQASETEVFLYIDHSFVIRPK
ncbi:hypothetical protein [Erythrobacter sp. JK5]|uniref:hypothetical protein n=1 Tax=Erythrobacter sp. JK5 TaxID=2829500 RepID=UPI001BA4E723|nr:hypothetical protein [Erythrobacter sp. JK5]QUL37559.1 hypothetical protein KDC96_14620 [Erythrobacter sp. JK5]